MVATCIGGIALALLALPAAAATTRLDCTLLVNKRPVPISFTLDGVSATYFDPNVRRTLRLPAAYRGNDIRFGVYRIDRRTLNLWRSNERVARRLFKLPRQTEGTCLLAPRR